MTAREGSIIPRASSSFVDSMKPTMIRTYLNTRLARQYGVAALAAVLIYYVYAALAHPWASRHKYILYKTPLLARSAPYLDTRSTC